MDVRLRIAVGSAGLNVAEFCRVQGISRQTFYVWRRRYVAEGPEGLVARSRAPGSRPGRIGADVEELIVGLRKELDDAGLDAGAATIGWHLGQRGVVGVPSDATIWRVLSRRGFVAAQPKKRPRSGWCRFEAGCPNELWQADTTEWEIATGKVKLLSFIDDHSRVALRVRAFRAESSEAVWETFSAATVAWGVPLGQLTDNGLIFSGKLRGHEVFFERQLRSIGVVAKTSRGYHPQTCGKVERFQQTLKKWLRRQPPAASLEALQTQLDVFVEYYNHHRPHRGIGRVTPAERWAATPPAINTGTALPGPAQRVETVVSPNGKVAVTRTLTVGIGSRYRGQTAVVHHDDSHVAVYIGHQLIRALTIDPTRRYQPLTPRGVSRDGAPGAERGHERSESRSDP